MNTANQPNKILNTDEFIGEHIHRHYKDTADTALKHNHEWWVDGIPVSKPLHAFITAFRAKRPAKIVLRVDGSAGTHLQTSDGHYWVWDRVGVAYPDIPVYKVGDIATEDGAYLVKSPRIINDKFKSDTDGRRTKKTKDLVKAVKNALQFLKPMTLEEIVGRNKYPLNNALDSVRSPARSKLRDKLSINMDDVATEVMNMLASGYKPVSGSFAAAIDLMQTEGAELRRLQNYKPRTCFVWVKQQSLVYKYSDSDEPAVEITNMSDMPEHLRDKLSMLNIADEGSAIADVGVRINAHCFWVFV